MPAVVRAYVRSVMTHRTTIAALVAIIVFVLSGCGAPTPEKACSHAVEVSPAVGQDHCVQALRREQEADKTNFEKVASCMIGAKNDATLRECGLGNLTFDREERARAQAKAASTGVAVTAPEELPEVTVPSSADRLSITNGDKGEVVLERKGDSWVVVSPLQGPAHESNIASVLKELRGMKAKAVIVASASDDDKKTYDFIPSKAVHVVAFEGTNKRLDISFGQSGPRGQLAMINGAPSIYAVTGYSSYLYTRDPKSWLK
jgi:hypothetical protein